MIYFHTRKKKCCKIIAKSIIYPLFHAFTTPSTLKMAIEPSAATIVCTPKLPPPNS